MNSGAENPTAAEIRDQLEHMLSGWRFRNARNQSDFLKLVTERAIEGKKTPGHIIAKELFGEKFKEKGTYLSDVRQAAHKLRATRKEYYGNEGRDDLVIISLPEPAKDKKVKTPEGESYTPTFSYNPVHPVGREYQLGMHHLKRGMWEDLEKARDHFTAVLKIAPEHIGASIGLSEAWIETLLLDKHTRNDEDQENVLRMAAQPLQRLGERGSGFWQLHALGGYILMGMGNLEKAGIAFATALRLDRASTEAYPKYFDYLVKIDKGPDASRLAKQHLEEHPSDMAAHLTYAKVLFRTNQLLDAAAILRGALELDRGYWAVHMWFAVAWLGIRQPAKALDHIMQLKLLADATTFRLVYSGCCKIAAEKLPQDKKDEWDKLASFFNRLFDVSDPSSPR